MRVSWIVGAVALLAFDALLFVGFRQYQRWGDEPLDAPVASTVSSASVAPTRAPVVVPLPIRVFPNLYRAVDQASRQVQAGQARAFAKIRNDELRQQGLLPARPLRDGEVCVGGTIVHRSIVGGVPTFEQVVQAGYRISCTE